MKQHQFDTTTATQRHCKYSQSQSQTATLIEAVQENVTRQDYAKGKIFGIQTFFLIRNSNLHIVVLLFADKTLLL